MIRFLIGIFCLQSWVWAQTQQYEDVASYPAPKIVFTVNGKEVSSGCSIKRGDVLRVESVPDAVFAQKCPKEAIYHIGEIRFYRKMSEF